MHHYRTDTHSSHSSNYSTPIMKTISSYSYESADCEKLDIPEGYEEKEDGTIALVEDDQSIESEPEP